MNRRKQSEDEGTIEGKNVHSGFELKEQERLVSVNNHSKSPIQLSSPIGMQDSNLQVGGESRKRRATRGEEKRGRIRGEEVN